MITSNQIRTVLRIYGNQLKKRALQVQDSVGEPVQSTDSVNISISARRKQMLDQISSKIISQAILNQDSQHDVRGKFLGEKAPFNLDKKGNKI